MSHSQLDALRVADEGFLVASLIERCPRTMMLRELVMNAVEAACGPDGNGQVDIGAALIGGTRKLRLRNTGRGLTAEELRSICDLASSIGKVNSLDGNFGMGAKVASLPSNRLGMRYRSLRNGRVSEVQLGQRNGVYGRLFLAEGPDGQPLDVADVTAACRADRDYDFSREWTEVVLFGNAADQDTVAAPYGAAMPVAADWIPDALTRRFHRLPDKALIRLEGPVSVSGELEGFVPLCRDVEHFTQTETVDLGDGLRVTYAYHREPWAMDTAFGARPGFGAIVYRNEIWGLVAGRQWIADAPALGIPFGGRHCAVLVELDDGFPVLPEAYRQFLRHAEGSQAQVALRDFAAAVRANIPAWLAERLALHRPRQPDFQESIRTEVQDLLKQLGIVLTAQGRRIPKPEPRSETVPPPSGAQQPAAAGSPPPPKPLPRPPAPPGFEIIGLEALEEIDEHGLQDRAAKYLPEGLQLFVNLRYAAAAELAVQLESECEGRAEPLLLAEEAQRSARWAMTRQMARTTVFGLSKVKTGWTAEQVQRAQSPEHYSLVAEDTAPMLAAARRHLATSLGLDAGAEGGGEGGAEPAAARPSLDWRRHLAGAQSRAEQAVAAAASVSAPMLAAAQRRLSDIHLQRKDPQAALEAARRAVQADPQQAASQLHLSVAHDHAGDPDAAEAAARRALELSAEAPGQALRRLALLAERREDFAAADGFWASAAAAPPVHPFVMLDRAAFLLRRDRGEEALALARSVAPVGEAAAPALRLCARIERHLGRTDAALDTLHAAAEAAPGDGLVWRDLALALLEADRPEAAREVALTALDLAPQGGVALVRAFAAIAARQQRHDMALEWLDRAEALEPGAAILAFDRANVLLAMGALDAAESVAEAALGGTPEDDARLLARLAEIARRRKDWPALLERADRLAALDPRNGWAPLERAAALTGLGRLEEAEAAARASIGLMVRPADRAAAYRRTVALARRRGDQAAAAALLDTALAEYPDNPGLLYDLSSLRLAEGQLDEATAAIEAARAQEPAARAAPYLRVLADIAGRKGDVAGATRLMSEALVLTPGDVLVLLQRSALHMRQGDLAAALADAEAAVGLAEGTDAAGAARARLEEIAARRALAAE